MCVVGETERGRYHISQIISVNSVVETVGQVDLVTKLLQLWSGHVVYSCHLQSSVWMDISGWEESKHGRSSFISTWQIFLLIYPRWDLPYSISIGSSTAHSHHVWKAHRCIWSTRECFFVVVLLFFSFNQTYQKHARSYHFHVQVKHGKENIKHKKKSFPFTSFGVIDQSTDSPCTCCLTLLCPPWTVSPPQWVSHYGFVGHSRFGMSTGLDELCQMKLQYHRKNSRTAESPTDLKKKIFFCNMALNQFYLLLLLVAHEAVPQGQSQL